MPNSYFKFKQFTVYQDKTAMKVGVDAVLLGSWAKPENAKSILDIGTGTGLLSLMLAQKCNASIVAIDIDLDAYNQAKFNIVNSLWENRITLFNNSFQDFYSNSKIKFDFIISNPPYFVKSLKSSDLQRNIARHDDLLPLENLFYGVSKLLSETGRFVLIYPYDQKNNLDIQAHNQQLYAIRELIIKGTENKTPNRVILEYSKQVKACISEELIVRENAENDYTEAYKKLTGAYYLAF